MVIRTVTRRGTSVKLEIPLSFDRFTTISPFRCKAVPGLNAHTKNCLPCVYAIRREHRIFCTLLRRPVSIWQNYSLKEWKSARDSILARESNQCVICERNDGLPVHHIDSDTTNDAPSNLVTLCYFCHSSIHAELDLESGAGRVQRVITHYRLQRKQVSTGD